MKSFFKNVLSTIVGMVLAVFVIVLLFIGIVSVSISSLNNDKEVTVKEKSILKINLTELTVVERTSENPFEGMNFSGDLPKTIALKQVLDNIEKAKTDEKIKAIYINTSFVNAGISQIEEIRNKLLEFKQTGKPIIAYSEVYSQAAYYLSSVANKIYLTPEGIIEIKGLSASIMFYKGLLEKLDIDAQIIRHGKFKGAVEPLILDKMSVANREQMQLFLNSVADNIMDSIANQRGLTLSEIQRHADNLSLENAKSCLNLNYVDALLYQDQLEDTLKALAGSEKLSIITLSKYTHAKGNKKEISRNKIAIIYANGEINSGKGDHQNIGSITTSKAIKQARKDKNVKAIVLRVNSPGGSALASDVIWRESVLAQQAKPLVVSMGDYAASGGYYIACAADTIVANPTTLTGSIGVFGMVPNFKRFYKENFGINLDTVNTNKYSDMGINRKMTQFEKNKIQQGVEDIYNVFLSKVGNGRNMTTQAVNEVGQGRIWSGYDAKEIGLIDVFGGLEKAIEIAKDLAKIEDYRIVSLPKKKDPFTSLMNNFSDMKIADMLLKDFKILNYSQIKKIKNIKKKDRIQARIPYNIILE